MGEVVVVSEQAVDANNNQVLDRDFQVWSEPQGPKLNFPRAVEALRAFTVTLLLCNHFPKPSQSPHRQRLTFAFVELVADR